MDEYIDDPEGFEEAKRRLFHKIDTGNLKLNLPPHDAMNHLEKLRHKDPRVLRNYAEKWHDVSHDHTDVNKVKFSDIKFTYQNMANQAEDGDFDGGFGFSLMHILVF